MTSPGAGGEIRVGVVIALRLVCYKQARRTGQSCSPFPPLHIRHLHTPITSGGHSSHGLLLNSTLETQIPAIYLLTTLSLALTITATSAAELLHGPVNPLCYYSCN